MNELIAICMDICKDAARRDPVKYWLVASWYDYNEQPETQEQEQPVTTTVNP